MSEEKVYEPTQKQTDSSPQEVIADPDFSLEPGNYMLTKSGISTGTGAARPSSRRVQYRIKVHILTDDDPLLEKSGEIDPIKRQAYQVGDYILEATYPDRKGELRSFACTLESFLHINPELKENDFAPVEEK